MPSVGQGVLVLVGTPLGNLADFGDANQEALRSADVICAEDTRHTRKLLASFDIHPSRLVSVREHNEEAMAGRIEAWMAQGKTVALVTDAGMPTLSDPGARVVRHVQSSHEGKEEGAGPLVRVVPGPDAATSALLAGGFLTDRWSFEGFLPVKGRERAQRLALAAAASEPTVFYEAPHRLLRLLGELAQVAGPEREIAVVKDLTKLFEGVWRGPVGTLRDAFADRDVRGEFVVIVGPLDG